jgi:hypothetical protein
MNDFQVKKDSINIFWSVNKYIFAIIVHNYEGGVMKKVFLPLRVFYFHLYVFMNVCVCILELESSGEMKLSMNFS